jgi:hypothetical protein
VRAPTAHPHYDLISPEKAAKEKMGLGGRRNPLKRLDSRKGRTLDFASPGLDFPSLSLGFSFLKAWVFLPLAWIFLPQDLEN